MFQVTDSNGVTTITASEGEKVIAKTTMPTAVFDVLTNINEPTPNKVVQQKIAEAAGWPLDKAGRCPKAAALLERVTPGYSVFNGTIAVMVGTSEGKNRFFHFNESLNAESKAEMLTRKVKAEAASKDPVVEEQDLQEDMFDEVNGEAFSDEAADEVIDSAE